jgi:tetratricopeptide (TPR) repeat protein
VNHALVTSLPVEATHLPPIIETLRAELSLEWIDLLLGLDLAHTQLQRGAIQEAFRTYAALVICEPMHGESQIGLSNCACRVGEYELALQASAAIAIMPEDPRGYCLSGKACLALGQIDDARDDLSRALELARPLERFAFVTEDADALLGKLAFARKPTIEFAAARLPRVDPTRHGEAP